MSHGPRPVAYSVIVDGFKSMFDFFRIIVWSQNINDAKKVDFFEWKVVFVRACKSAMLLVESEIFSFHGELVESRIEIGRRR